MTRLRRGRGPRAVGPALLLLAALAACAGAPEPAYAPLIVRDLAALGRDTDALLADVAAAPAAYPDRRTAYDGLADRAGTVTDRAIARTPAGRTDADLRATVAAMTDYRRNLSALERADAAGGLDVHTLARRRIVLADILRDAQVYEGAVLARGR
ncbi:MAG: hypothetical protein ACFBSD_01465 [Paracoccaceae bacterium]